MPVFKKYQCRYFDENGNSLNPSCNQGDRCRYVHPTDPNWPGLKPAPSISPKGVPRNDFNSADRDTKSRAPLVPQSEMFRLCKDEDANSWTLEDDHRRTRDWDSRDRDHNKTRERNRSRDHARPRNTTQSATASKSRQRSDYRRRSPSQHAAKDISKPLLPDEATKRATRLTELFRRLARLSNQAFQDTAACEAANHKLQTYTDISATLSKVSTSAVDAIAPTMAEIVHKQASSKQSAEEGFANLEAVWEEIFDVMIAEVAKAINDSLGQALDSLRNEAERISMGSEDSKRSMKRRDTAATWSEEEEHGDRKRRRLSRWSPSSSPRSEPSPKLSLLHNILNEMKSKLDQQTHALQALTKENSELKETFRRTASVGNNTPGGHKTSMPTEPRSSRSASGQDTIPSHDRPTRSTYSPRLKDRR